MPQFIMTHDRDRRYRLASMQSAVGADLFRRHGVDPSDPDTILVTVTAFLANARAAGSRILKTLIGYYDIRRART